MNPMVRNILAVLAGALIGGTINMLIIILSDGIIPLPPGVDATDPESLKSSMHLFEPRHFIFPFLAHSLGTLVGAVITVKLAASHHMKLALLIGVFFLIGGIANTFMISPPTWYAVLDIVAAYLPMGWLGWKLAGAPAA